MNSRLMVPDIRCPPAALLAVALLAALAGSGACQRVKIEETDVEITRDSSDLCVQNGRGGSGGNSMNMDTYVIQVFEINDPTNAPYDACDRCAATGEGCHEGRQICMCGGQIEATPKQLRTNLSGTKLGSLDYEDLYCLRVVAINRMSLSGDPPAECPCQPDWLMPGNAPDNARLCAVSSAYSAGPLRVSLPVRCPNDGRPFYDCIGLSSM